MIYANVDEQNRTAVMKAMDETQDKKWYRRLKIIDLSGQGHAVPELAILFDLNPQTIRNYIHRVNQGGIPDLEPDYGQGRGLELDWTKAQWLELLGQAPSQFEALESGAQNWTQALMVKYLAA